MYLANNPPNQNGYRRVIGICFVLFLSYCSPLTAQVNIFTGETIRQMQLDPGWYKQYRLGFNISYRQYRLADDTRTISIRLSLKEVSQFCFRESPVRTEGR